MIEILTRLSPVPIEFSKNREQMGDAGLYFDEDKYASYSPHIEIANNLKEHYRISVLVHEIGHALCSKNNCKCMINRDDHTLAEYHAVKFELRWLLKYKQKKALKLTIEAIKNCLSRVDSNAHYRAAKRIVKLKLWQKCLDYTGEEK